MACRWMYDRKMNLRWFYPQCYGGLQAWDVSGCYCKRDRSRIEELEDRIETLEQRIEALTTGKGN